MSERGSPVEDGGSDVSGPKGRELSAGQKLGLVALIGVVALGFIWFNFLLRKNAPPAERPAVATAGPGLKYTPPPADKAPSTDALPLPASASTADTTKADAAPPPILAYSGGGMAGGAGLRPGSLAVPMPGDADVSGTPASSSAAPTSSNASQSNLARLLKPTNLSGASASVIKNPDMVVTEGTVMPCTLQTAIDTHLAGFVTCVVSLDVRGTTGNVVLLDRGTKIVGQIENGLVQGQERVFVLWTRAETPNHVVISLNSPGADELGRAGLPGEVDNHWWQRFGGALMLTLLQGSLNAGTALAANSGSGNNNQATMGFVYGAQSSGNQIANTALENSINIPPTLRKNQGDTVSVFVAQDLDFSGVYRLRLGAQANGG
jgi:type IV secretion system protein VirB10